MAPDELLRYPLVVVGNLALPAQRRDVAGATGRWAAVGIMRIYVGRVRSGALTLLSLSRTSCQAL